MIQYASLFNIKLSSFWRDAAWLASSTALAQLIALAARPIFSRLYTPADFAALNLFTIGVSFTAIAVTWRYENLVQLPRRLADGWRLVQATALLGGLTVLVLTPLAFWQGPVLADWLDCPSLARWAPLVPLAGLLYALSIALAGWHQRRRQFRSSGQSEVAGQLVYAGLGGLGWLLFTGPGGLILAFLGTYGGKIFWLVKNRRDIYPPGSLVKIKAAARRYGALSKSLIFSQTCLTVTVAIPSFYIARAHGAEELGQFALAWQIIVQPMNLLGNAIGNTYYQRAAELWAQGSSFKDLWRSTVKKIILMGLSVYGAAFCLSPWLFPLIFGQAWVKAGQYAVPLSVGAFFEMVTWPLSKTCLVVGAWRYVSLWHLARTISTALVALAAWRAAWGMRDFLMAFVLQQSLLYLVDFCAEWRFAGFRPNVDKRKP